MRRALLPGRKNIQASISRLLAMNIAICQLSELRRFKIKFTTSMLFMDHRISRARHKACLIGSS